MNEEKITIWEERIHACQNSDLTVAAWCREHQISVATYYYWRKRVSANDEMLSVKEPVFAELTNIRKAALSEEKKPLLISFNQLQLAVSTPAQAELAAVLISRMQSLRWSSIFVTFTLKKIIDWNISFQTVSCIHLMNVDVYDCNSHIHNPACFHLTLDLFQTDSVA